MGPKPESFCTLQSYQQLFRRSPAVVSARKCVLSASATIFGLGAAGEVRVACAGEICSQRVGGRAAPVTASWRINDINRGPLARVGGICSAARAPGLTLRPVLRIFLS